MGRNAEKHQRTCYLSIFRAPIFSCNGWFLWWTPRSDVIPAISCKLQVDTPQLSTAESSVDIVDIVLLLMRWSPTKNGEALCNFDGLRIDVETETK